MLWAIIWDMLRDAELSATDFVDIFLSAIEFETNISTVTTLGGQLQSAIEVYASPKNRDSLRVKAAAKVYEVLKNAEAGGDFQLQFTRVFLSLASKEDAPKISAILNGDLAGLVLDLDMRWLLTNSLVERGVYGVKELDLELARDNSLAAQLSHALGLAAQPTKEAKETAWHKITKEEMSSAFREKTLQGFMRIGQRELLSTWVDPYFDNLLEMWGKKSYDISSSYVELCYPALQISQAVVDKTNIWIANEGKGAAAGLIRLLGEARDAMVRALNAQSKDN
jgi:aminopeptidase N